MRTVWVLLVLFTSLIASANSPSDVEDCTDITIENQLNAKNHKNIADVARKIIPSCAQKNLKLGDSCMTAKGFEFKLIGIDERKKEIYADVETGVIWGDKLDKV